MAVNRRIFTDEFKAEAVRLVTVEGHPARQVARDLDIHESLLRRWQRKLAARQARAPEVKPPTTVAAAIIIEQEKIRKLKRENERLRMERDILKTIADRSSACGRRNGWRYHGRWRGAAVGFLEAYDPVKKHGPRAGADLGMVTPSWRSRLGS